MFPHNLARGLSFYGQQRLRDEGGPLESTAAPARGLCWSAGRNSPAHLGANHKWNTHLRYYRNLIQSHEEKFNANDFVGENTTPLRKKQTPLRTQTPPPPPRKFDQMLKLIWDFDKTWAKLETFGGGGEGGSNHELGTQFRARDAMFWSYIINTNANGICGGRTPLNACQIESIDRAFGEGRHETEWIRRLVPTADWPGKYADGVGRPLWISDVTLWCRWVSLGQVKFTDWCRTPLGRLRVELHICVKTCAIREDCYYISPL